MRSSRGSRQRLKLWVRVWDPLVPCGEPRGCLALSPSPIPPIPPGSSQPWGKSEPPHAPYLPQIPLGLTPSALPMQVPWVSACPPAASQAPSPRSGWLMMRWSWAWVRKFPPPPHDPPHASAVAECPPCPPWGRHHPVREVPTAWAIAASPPQESTARRVCAG